MSPKWPPKEIRNLSKKERKAAFFVFIMLVCVCLCLLCLLYLFVLSRKGFGMIFGAVLDDFLVPERWSKGKGMICGNACFTYVILMFTIEKNPRHDPEMTFWGDFLIPKRWSKGKGMNCGNACFTNVKIMFSIKHIFQITGKITSNITLLGDFLVPKRWLQEKGWFMEMLVLRT